MFVPRKTKMQGSEHPMSPMRDKGIRNDLYVKNPVFPVR